MVTYELINDNAEDLLYAYHPEGDLHHTGVITYNRATHNAAIIEHAATDHGAHYANRLVHHLATTPNPTHSGTLA